MVDAAHGQGVWHDPPRGCPAVEEQGELDLSTHTNTNTFTWIKQGLAALSIVI